MFEKIKEVLLQYSPAQESLITEDAKLQDDLELDSFDIMKILMELEDVFGFRVSNENVVNIATVRDLEKFIAGKAAR